MEAVPLPQLASTRQLNKTFRKWPSHTRTDQPMPSTKWHPSVQEKSRLPLTSSGPRASEQSLRSMENRLSKRTSMAFFTRPRRERAVACMLWENPSEASVDNSKQYTIEDPESHKVQYLHNYRSSNPPISAEQENSNNPFVAQTQNSLKHFNQVYTAIHIMSYKSLLGRRRRVMRFRISSVRGTPQVRMITLL